MQMIADIINWLPHETRAACILQMSHKWIEQNYELCDANFSEIFYQRTWSLEFLERTLKPEDSDMWDHISSWYTLTEPFCQNNIDWLNFHDLVYNQTLSREFYLQYEDKFDWIPIIDRKRIFQQFYENL